MKRTYLKNHLSSHDGNIFKCNICDKEFIQEINLRRHEKAVHNDEKVKCSLCDKFVTESLLKLHLKQKHNSLPKTYFSCDICERRFKGTDSLRYHYKTKHSKTRYKCSSCETFYSTLGSLKRHVDSGHLTQKKHLTISKNIKAEANVVERYNIEV